jgi:16S rRNA (guanine966-N2)-methyltransferase
MTRIVAGRWGGRRLAVPARGTRPTSERVREAVMNTLTNRLDDWEGTRVLDLFAGSGALGFEALSRGAAWATFVDSERAAVRVLKDNAAALATQDWTIVARDAKSVVSRPNPDQPYRVVFADPPYDSSMVQLRDVLAGVAGNGWIRRDAILVVETARRGRGEPWPPELASEGFRDYGDTRIWYGLARAANSDPPA